MEFFSFSENIYQFLQKITESERSVIYWFSSANTISGKNLALELLSRMCSSNHIAGFFKLQYLKKDVSDCVDFLCTVRHPWKLKIDNAILVQSGNAFPKCSAITNH